MEMSPNCMWAGSCRRGAARKAVKAVRRISAGERYGPGCMQGHFRWHRLGGRGDGRGASGRLRIHILRLEEASQEGRKCAWVRLRWEVV
jgi:hypothetical protein